MTDLPPPVVVAGTAAAPSVALSSDAIEVRDGIVWSATTCTAVETPADSKYCGELIVQIATLEKAVEAARVEIKDPYLKVGREIDAAARRFLEPVLAEKARLDTLLKTYLRREMDAKRKAEAEAEAKRIEEAKREKAEAEKKAKENGLTVRTIEAPLPPPAVSPARPAAPVSIAKGMSAKPVWNYEVLNTQDLYKARPELCTVTPKADAIRAAIAAGEREISGLRIFEDVGINTRTKGVA